MQEVFVKIKERLKVQIKEITKWDSNKHYIYQEGVDWMGDKAIEIVNQVAEEYDNDFCEWESDFNWFSGKCKHETSCGYTFYDLKHAEPFKVCPYCSKKIKDIKYGGTNMSKAVLVIDAPKSCDECQFIDEQYHFCAVPWFGKDVTDYIACRHPECPLKPLPEKQELAFATHGEDMIAMGWNAAIEAIENDLK